MSDYRPFPSVPILDHGYCQLIEVWGSDQRVVEAARMSTDKGFLGWGTGDAPGDEKLLAHLMNADHASPFEMAGLVFEIQCPILVVREWQRHRTQSYNEMSARYVPLPDLNYAPTVERCLLSGGTNKQAGLAKGATAASEAMAYDWIEEHLRPAYVVAEAAYQEGLRLGIPKELARLVVPVGRYTRMRASANLRNWLAFLTLRNDAAAQWEIRQYAIEVDRVIQIMFPRVHEVYVGKMTRMRSMPAEIERLKALVAQLEEQLSLAKVEQYQMRLDPGYAAHADEVRR